MDRRKKSGLILWCLFIQDQKPSAFLLYHPAAVATGSLYWEYESITIDVSSRVPKGLKVRVTDGSVKVTAMAPNLCLESLVSGFPANHPSDIYDGPELGS